MSVSIAPALARKTIWKMPLLVVGVIAGWVVSEETYNHRRPVIWIHKPTVTQYAPRLYGVRIVLDRQRECRVFLERSFFVNVPIAHHDFDYSVRRYPVAGEAAFAPVGMSTHIVEDMVVVPDWIPIEGLRLKARIWDDCGGTTGRSRAYDIFLQSGQAVED